VSLRRLAAFVLLAQSVSGTAGAAALQRSGEGLLDVVVLGEGGGAVTDLGPGDFVLLRNGEEFAVEVRSVPSAPWHVLLLFDRGLIGRQAYPWEEVVEGVSGFLASLGAGDRVSVAMFDSRVESGISWRSAPDLEVRDLISLDPFADPPGRPSDRRARDAQDVYRALDWAASEVGGLPDRKAVVVLTDGRDDRLSPRWFSDGPDLGLFGVVRRPAAGIEIPVLDPLFGLPDSGELAAYRASLDAVAASGARFFFLGVDTGRPPVFGRNVVSGLFPGAAVAVGQYLDRVRSRLEGWAAASRGGVIHRSFGEGIRLYADLYRALGMGIRYTLVWPDGGGDSEAPDLRARGAGLRVVRLPDTISADSDR
jgi:hypothetical protein